MEHKPITTAKSKTQKGGDRDGLPKRKKLNPIHFFRAAIYMLTLKSGKSKSAHVDVASKWKKLVSSVRPLHIHSNQSPPRTIETTPAQPEPVAPLTEVIEPFEVFTPPLSPAKTSIASSSSGISSQYASAQNLQDLDQSDESDEDDEDRYYDDKVGDEMIDAKAEQFIAQFYEQMRLQHKTYRNHHN